MILRTCLSSACRTLCDLLALQTSTSHKSVVVPPRNSYSHCSKRRSTSLESERSPVFSLFIINPCHSQLLNVQILSRLLKPTRTCLILLITLSYMYTSSTRRGSKPVHHCIAQCPVELRAFFCARKEM